MDGRHRHHLPRRGAVRGQRPDRLGRPARRPGRPDVPYPLRVDTARLRELQRRAITVPVYETSSAEQAQVHTRRLGRECLHRRAGHARGLRGIGARPAARPQARLADRGRRRGGTGRAGKDVGATPPSRSAARSPRRTIRRPSSTRSGRLAAPRAVSSPTVPSSRSAATSWSGCAPCSVRASVPSSSSCRSRTSSDGWCRSRR